MFSLKNINFMLDPGEIDQLLGFRIPEIERDLLARAMERNPDGNHHVWGENLHDGNQSWVGLHPQTLLTPYSELKRVCDFLSPNAQELVVDLGAGYGRLGIVMGQICPEARFLGYELVRERVEEGVRLFSCLELPDAELLEQDLTCRDFQLPEAHYYFIYDYGKVSHIRQTLDQLSALADKRTFKIVGRGKGTRSLIEHEYLWLTQIYQEENFSIYSM